MSRTSKVTSAAAQRVVEALKLGNSHAAAIGAGPISASTFYSWLAAGRSDPDGDHGKFATAVAEAEQEAERLLVAEWRSQCPSDWRACAELLARRFPTRWARQQSRYEMTGPSGEPVAVEVAIRAALAAVEAAQIEELARMLDDYFASPDPENWTMEGFRSSVAGESGDVHAGARPQS